MKIIISYILASMIFAASVFAQIAVVKINSNIRENPTTSSKIVAYVTKGDKVHVIKSVKNKADKLWYQIEQGYISGRLLSLQKPAQVKITFLTSVQIKKLLLNKTRAGKTRYSGKNSLFKSILLANGQVKTSLIKLNGEKIKDLPIGKWKINKGTLCITRGKRTNISCRKIFKQGNKYVSVLTSDKKIWAKFNTVNGK